MSNTAWPYAATSSANPELTPSQVAALSAWEAAKKARAAAEEDEIEKRRAVVAVFFNPNAVNEGMNNFALPNGYTLKYGKKLNYNLADNDRVDNFLDKLAVISNEGGFLRDRIVSWKPSLSISEYRLIVEDAKTSATKKQMLDALIEVLTITEGAPALEIKEPKSKR